MSELRGRLREQRRAITNSAQEHAAAGLLARTGPWFETLSRSVAGAYVATDGEPDVRPLVGRLRRLGWQVAYPRIAEEAMAFHIVDDEADLVEGRWGLMEPAPSAKLVQADSLRLVLTPLVGFDGQCNRIGRGKGYYDTAFQFLLHRNRPSRPVLVGIAHDIQRLDAIDVAPHDVPLDVVVTPSTVHGVLPGSGIRQ